MTYRALIVDDEPAVRMVTIRELTRRGFSCDGASNGWEAMQLAATQSYDVVVTDLRMPEMNGHTFSVDLLAKENRPVLVVLTGVSEPKIAKDLLARGVDDIMFKPVDQGVVAVKVLALVEQRAARLAAAHGGAPVGRGSEQAVAAAGGGPSAADPQAHKAAATAQNLLAAAPAPPPDASPRSLPSHEFGARPARAGKRPRSTASHPSPATDTPAAAAAATKPSHEGAADPSSVERSADESAPPWWQTIAQSGKNAAG